MSIRINDLTVRFKNGVVAVNKASLEIPKGIYGLLGENGAGKSTLMNVLTGVFPRDKGEIEFDGNELKNTQVYPNNKLFTKEENGKWGFVDNNENKIVDYK